MLLADTTAFILIAFSNLLLWPAEFLLRRHRKNSTILVWALLSSHFCHRRLFFHYGISCHDKTPYGLTRCVELHNHIADHALAILEANNITINVQTNWFTFHGQKAENVRSRLTPSVISFLENVKVWDIGDLSLTPYLRGIPAPSSLLLDQEFGFDNCILLYQNNDVEEGRGLVLWMEHNKAHDFQWADEFPWDDTVWYHLEPILSIYWSQILEGKYVVDLTRFGDPKEAPMYWRVEPYTEHQINRTLVMWRWYVGLVHDRMPPHQAHEYGVGLVDAEKLDKWNIQGFTREILLRAAKPPFKHIVPGLTIIDNEFVDHIGPELVARRERWNRGQNLHAETHSAFPLFVSDLRVAYYAFSDRDRDHIGPFWKMDRLLDDRCGIYVTSPDPYEDADTVSVVAPFAWRDGTEIRFAEAHGPFEASVLNRFVQGIRNACSLPSSLRLIEMLAMWYDMVADGRWTVGIDGVEGSIDDLWDFLPAERLSI